MVGHGGLYAALPLPLVLSCPSGSTTAFSFLIDVLVLSGVTSALRFAEALNQVAGFCSKHLQDSVSEYVRFYTRILFPSSQSRAYLCSAVCRKPKVLTMDPLCNPPKPHQGRGRETTLQDPCQSPVKRPRASPTAIPTAFALLFLLHLGLGLGSLRLRILSICLQVKVLRN